jgi:undecaprenyl diphosphate synthase
MNPLRHVAIIMDGNGRWAERRGWPRFYGHLRGVKAAKRAIRYARHIRLPILTLYTFSMENWSRPQEEVNLLMRLIEKYFVKDRAFLNQHQIQVRVWGHRPSIPERLLTLLADIEDLTRSHEGIRVNLALSYSGRQEILDGLIRWRNDPSILNSPSGTPTESEFRRILYDGETPDPDLLIRTGGEYRISNFLLWQLAYTELFFTDTLWPDFEEEDFSEIIEWYASRQRRFGQVQPKVEEHV